MLAGDLNASHIGQRFNFIGSPPVEGVLEGFLLGDPGTKRIYVAGEDRIWSSDFTYGYYINNKSTVIPLEPVPVVDPVKARLAEYIQGRYRDWTGEYLSPKRSSVVVDIFMELMEGGTDANGEG